MEALLASYGSDDEDDVDPQQQAPPLLPFRSQTPLFASLPPPHFSESPATDTSAHPSTLRGSLFASLPRPKSASTSKQQISVAKEEVSVSNGANRAREARDGTLRDVGKAYNDAGDEFRVSDVSFRVADGETRVVEKESASLPQSDKRTSLFSALPPPKSLDSSMLAPLGPLKAQPSSSGASKRVVEFRPSINMALLQDLDDDDVRPQAKRHAMAPGKGTGLAAILPKPKNRGATLGSGFAPGHHATLEIGDAVNYSPLNSESIVLETAHDSSSSLNGHAAETWNNHHHSAEGDLQADASESHANNLVETFENYGHVGGADLQRNVDTTQWTTPSSSSYHSSFASQDSSEVFASEGDCVPDHHYQGVLAHETYTFTGSHQAISDVQDPLANILKKERRKGGKDVAPNFIEVKQSDLTATKLREDQLRTTGIAFGPAYKPISSNKDKPSKLHRRKHQIGSLYYDMKQKEMELLERRSRGTMTKSETQAKYGW